jgi:DNA-binding FadR family transcriptional regulator
MKNKEVILKRASLPEQIIEVLRRDIFSGIIRPGEDLPSERELSERFGTSRGTMRKALASLAQEGWIEIVHGRGNTVRDFTHSMGIEVLPQLLLSCPEAVIKPDIFAIMFEFSSWLYSQIYLLAAKKASSKDREVLLGILADHEEGESVTKFWDNYFRFIDELLRISGNILLQMYFNSQKQFIREAIKSGMVKEIPFPLPAYLALNVSLAEAICANDPAKVRKIMADLADDMAKAYRRFFEFATKMDQV